jgi:hypothetical protein
MASSILNSDARILRMNDRYGWAMPMRGKSKNQPSLLRDCQILGTRAPSPAIEREARTIVGFLRLLSVLRTLCGRGRPRSQH